MQSVGKRRFPLLKASSTPLPALLRTVSDAPQRRLRPRDKVLRFLKAEMETGRIQSGTRLPTNRELAAELGVSISTVQAVFSELGKEGVIDTRIGNGTFYVAQREAAQERGVRIGMSFGRQGGSRPNEFWHLAISGAILEAASEYEDVIAVTPVRLRHTTREETLADIKNVAGAVDGLILDPNFHDASIRHLLDELRLPTAFLNPPDFFSTCNFVSINFCDASIRIARAFVASERERLFFIHHSEQEMRVSAALRYTGLISILNAHPSVKLESHFCEENSEAGGYKMAARLLKRGLDRRVGIYCVSDLVAAGVYRYCVEHHIAVPDGVSIVGGTGVLESVGAAEGLTRTSQPVKEIGVKLVEMVRTLVKSGGTPLPGVYLPTRFLGGGSTSGKENEILGLTQPLIG